MEQEHLKETRIEKNLIATLSDGVSIAADLIMPEGEGPFPTIICYYPYHKDGLVGVITEYPRRYFAERGYACLLADFRGHGNSAGKAWDMLDPGEARDGAEIVEWAATQSWCDGNVGMWGISYGGITSLQSAAERPPHLKAIAPIFAVADNYHDFIYPGGCPNCLGTFGAWGSFMVAMGLMPPGYQDPQGRWYRVWKERLEDFEPQMLAWQDHPEYDEYWQNKVIPVEKINIPTFVIGSWRDIFPEAMVNLYENLRGPKKLFMGPWMHAPMDIYPVESWDYLHEMKRWWDYWLRGEENGIMDESPATIFVQGTDTWRHENEWPISRTREQILFISKGNSLSKIKGSEEGVDLYEASSTVGAMAGLWDPLSLCVGLPLDQGTDDLKSLTYSTDPLEDDMEITGSPEATLYIATESSEKIHLVAKLCAVGPDGSSTLITTGWLNGSHRRSHEKPESLVPGEVNEFRICLWATAYVVPKGCRLRLSVSCADFPRIWPTPTNPRIRLSFGGAHGSFLCIPVVPALVPPLQVPKIKRPDPAVNRLPSAIDGVPRWEIKQDLVNGTLVVVTGEVQQFSLPTGGKFKVDFVVKASTMETRPDASKIEGITKFCLDLPRAGRIEVETKTLISQTRMLITGKVKVDDRLFFEKQWRK